jgi:hypothetical protein
MTLYCVVIAAGEQVRMQRLSVHPVKSIIVWIAWQHLTYAKDRGIIKRYERRYHVSIPIVLEIL